MAMTDETNLYLTGINTLDDVLGPELGDDDLLEYVQKAADAESQIVRDLYRDAVIAAIYYDAHALSGDDFSELLKRFRSNSDFLAFNSQEYITADPWSRTEIGSTSVLAEGGTPTPEAGTPRAEFISSYLAAGAAAQNRLYRYVSNDGANAFNSLVAKIDNYRDSGDQDPYRLSQLIGPDSGEGDFINLNRYMQIGADTSRSATERGMYQDVVIASVLYFARQLNDQAFQALNINFTRSSDFTSLNAQEYLKEDPFSRKSITL